MDCSDGVPQSRNEGEAFRSRRLRGPAVTVVRDCKTVVAIRRFTGFYDHLPVPFGRNTMPGGAPWQVF
jgi:hypothetical protein